MGLGDALSKRWLLVEALGISILTLVSILISGYRGLLGANYPLQLIVVQKILDPSLYPNDPFVEQTWQSYASVLWYLVAFLARWIDLKWVLLILFILQRLLFIWAGWQLGRVLLPYQRLSGWAGALFIAWVPESIVGAGHPLRESVEQTGFATLFILLSLSAALRQRWLAMGVYWGLAASMNLMYGLFGTFYLVAAVRSNDWKSPPFWQGIGVATGLGLPGVELVARAAGRMVSDETVVWQAAELLYPEHFFPHIWSTERHLKFIGFTALALWIAQRSGRVEASTRRLLTIWTLIAVGWYTLAWLTPYVFQSRLLLHLQPARGQDIWMLSAGIFGTGMLLGFLHQHRSQIVRAMVIFVVLVVGMRALARSVGRLQEEGNVLGVPKTACQDIAAWARTRTSKEAVFLIPIGLEEEWLHFRHLSQRNVFVHWKDGSGWTYAPAYATTWLARLRLLGLFEKHNLDPRQYRIGYWTRVGRRCYEVYDELYQSVDETVVRRIVAKYRVDYWITYATQRTTFPVVYRAGRWKVVQISERATIADYRRTR